MKSVSTSRLIRVGGFTLIELLVSISIISLLTCILVPSLAQARHLARKTVCASNLRTVQLAHTFYFEDNNGNFFPYRQTMTGGAVLWYWGLEPVGSGAEGSRIIDPAKARLYPYFPKYDRLKVCPSIPYEQGYFKAKYALAGYGYGINPQLLASATLANISQVTKPDQTISWADSAQINTWQAPASPANPMLEEWYLLSNNPTIPSFHFRHMLSCNAAYADGSVRPLQNSWLDSRVDGLTGGPEPAVADGISPMLQIKK